MQKIPEADLKFQYRRTLETSAALSLFVLIVMLMVFKKFEVDVSVRAIDAPAIEVEDIPITRTIKKVEVPRKPTIPVEDPDTPLEDDVPIGDIDEFWGSSFKPPPPPPPDEVIQFFKVEIKPTLIGGNAAIADYIKKNNLFPRMAREAGVSGKVLIGFVVDKEGKTREVKVIQEVPEGLGFGEAGVKVMTAMCFTPGMQRDKPVAVRMQQPIKFTFGSN